MKNYSHTRQLVIIQKIANIKKLTQHKKGTECSPFNMQQSTNPSPKASEVMNVYRQWNGQRLIELVCPLSNSSKTRSQLIGVLEGNGIVGRKTTKKELPLSVAEDMAGLISREGEE